MFPAGVKIGGRVPDRESAAAQGCADPRDPHADPCSPRRHRGSSRYCGHVLSLLRTGSPISAFRCEALGPLLAEFRRRRASGVGSPDANGRLRVVRSEFGKPAVDPNESSAVLIASPQSRRSASKRSRMYRCPPLCLTATSLTAFARVKHVVAPGLRRR